MLLRENLSRRHERHLEPVLHRDDRRDQGDDRLAGPNVTLKKPLHRPRFLHVRHDLRECVPLPVGELEGENRARGLPDAIVDGRDERLLDRRVLLTPEGEPCLKDEEVWKAFSA